jgi:(R)-2-hydroxyacyl-CoA dehydratese activating ATPase
MIGAGIDAGSRTIKAVLFDAASGRMVASGIADQGVDQARLTSELYQQVLSKASVASASVTRVVATGYGRNRVPFADTTITEITCHARGVGHLVPAARSIIEIGGQDSKVIWLEAGGRVRDFAMNDRCAAGTGRFLEVVAARLGLDFTSLSEIGRTSRQPALISNTCVVFAETEIVGLLAEAIPPPDIVAGVHQAIATRVAALAAGMIADPVVFTGGVALQSGVVLALQTVLGRQIQVVPLPQFTGALGAAILATQSDNNGLRTL